MDPVQQLNILKRRINSPKVDLLETENTYVVRLELSYRSFKWNLIDEQILLLSTDKQIEFNDNYKLIYSEAKYGKITRRVKLPSKVNNVPIRDEYNEGILILEFKKQN